MRPYILVRGSKIRDILLDLELEYDDEDLELVQDWVDASVRRIAPLDVWIYKVGALTVSIVPVTEEQLEETIPSLVQKAYYDVLAYSDLFPRVVGLFKGKADELVHESLFQIRVPGIQLEDKVEETFPTKKGFETVNIATYLISKQYEGDQGFHFDIRAMFALCNGAIDHTHIGESLEPSKHMNILVVLFYNKDGLMVGIRTTKLYTARRAKIVGAFACSTGYGMLIQQYTEDLLRLRGDLLFPLVRPDMQRAMTFKLSALGDASGFWKRVGFKDTGKRDADGLEILEKSLYPIDEGSQLSGKVVATKRKPSSTSSTTKTTKIQRVRGGNRKD